MYKVILIDKWFHHKNYNALLQYSNTELTIINTPEELCNYDLSTFDAVYSPSLAIDVTEYPNAKLFIFGPHFSVFPEPSQLKTILPSAELQNKIIYLMPSQWPIDLWQIYISTDPILNKLKMKALPFGVDTNKFIDNASLSVFDGLNDKPSTIKNKVFIYYKHRSPYELNIIESFLTNKEIEYKIFDYLRRYDENEYITYLQECKYGIILDAHESQGFAIEEALSCNVPLLVWNAISFNQVFGSVYPDVFATSVPYWDERCGELFHYEMEFESKWNTFQAKLEQYKPREYILENISINACQKKWGDIITNKNT